MASRLQQAESKADPLQSQFKAGSRRADNNRTSRAARSGSSSGSLARALLESPSKRRNSPANNDAVLTCNEEQNTIRRLEAKRRSGAGKRAAV